MIHLVRTQNFPKNTQTYVRVCIILSYQGVKNISFMVNFAYVLNEWSPNVNAATSKFLETYLEPPKTSMMVLLCQNINQLKTVTFSQKSSTFRKKAPS